MNKKLNNISSFQINSLKSIVFFFSFFLSLCIYFPASWLDFFLMKLSNDTLRIVNTQGTVWSGSGDLILYPSRIFEIDPQILNNFQRDKSFIKLAKNLKWEVKIGEIRSYEFGLQVKLNHPSLKWTENSNIEISRNTLMVPSGEVVLPQLDLSSGSGLIAFFKPQFQLTVNWKDFFLSKGLAKGNSFFVEASLNNFETKLSPIKPLGSYRVLLIGNKNYVEWNVGSSKSSNLIFNASGEFSQFMRGRGQLRCLRHCEHLAGLMSVVGKKQGENVYGVAFGD